MIVSPTVELSPSRVEGAQKCHRKHVLAEICGQQPDGGSSAPLVFGERMHAAVALRWRHDDVHAGWDYLAAQPWPLNDKHTANLAQLMWNGYVRDARLMPFGDASEWVIETLEDRKTIRRAMCNLSFQIDRLLRNTRTGQLALVDLKTASRCDAKWTNQWSRSLQMKLYAACVAELYGQPLSWLIIEGLSKDKYAVNYVALPTFSEEVREEALNVVAHVAENDAQVLATAQNEDGSIDIDRLLNDALTQTGFNPAECFSYFSACAYLPLCEAEPSDRRALLADGYHYEQPKHLV